MRSRQLAAVSLLLVGFLGGCAYEPLVWTHRTSGTADYERDSAQCRYEASRGMGNYNALVTLCMQARGWYQVRPDAFVFSEGTLPVPPNAVPRVQSAYTLPLPLSGEPSAPDVAAPSPTRDKATGRWAYAAERVTAFHFRCEQPRAYLTSSSIRTEFFEVVCASGMSVPIQCDYAECALQ